MAFSSSCFCHPQVLLKNGLVMACKSSLHSRTNTSSSLGLERVTSKSAGQRDGGTNLSNNCSFLRGSRSIIQPELRRTVLYKKRFSVYASLVPASQIASSVFTLGTAAVLPFYTLMVVAPRAEVTKRSMESSLPYVVLGIVYAYLLYLSWTPETLGRIFANQYWMPELPGIAKMFSNEMTLASAWIHLLAVDLFAARQVYHDGLQNNVETRHSVSLCLLFCPVGVLTHFITKNALARRAKRNKSRIH